MQVGKMIVDFNCAKLQYLTSIRNQCVNQMNIVLVFSVRQPTLLQWDREYLKNAEDHKDKLLVVLALVSLCCGAK